MNKPEATSLEKTSETQRIDFLTHSINFTEGNIRAFDMKSQIALAAYVLSLNPILAVLRAACPGEMGRTVMLMLAATVLITVLLFLWSIWPIHPVNGSVKGSDVKSAFYPESEQDMTVQALLGLLCEIRLESELAAQTLKLARIRDVKARRFKLALGGGIASYGYVAAAFVASGACGGG